MATEQSHNHWYDSRIAKMLYYYCCDFELIVCTGFQTTKKVSYFVAPCFFIGNVQGGACWLVVYRCAKNKNDEKG